MADTTNQDRALGESLRAMCETEQRAASRREPTSHGELHQWAWTFAGEQYAEGSSHPWRPVEDSGVIEADHPAVALIMLLTGQPYDGNPLPFGTVTFPEYDMEREITITIRPKENDREETT